jgi:hypothetical protein
MAIGSLYKLTSKGRQVARSINPNRRDEILDYLYRARGKNNEGGATVDELEAVTGKSKGVLLALLAKYKGHGYVRDESGGEF